MVDYYRSASVYVAPTLYENLPIRVLEAMGCGVPVVASRVCAIPEAIEDGVNGLLVSPGCVDELSDAVCRLLGDSSFSDMISDNARASVVERFNWDVNAFRVIDVYNQIISACSVVVN